MDVFFETRTGKSFSIEIGFFDSVLEIKEKVQKYQGIPIARQTLIFKGQSLEDDGNVENCELLHNSRIQLIIAPENPGKTEESPATPSTKILLILRMPTSKKQVEMDVDDTILQLKEKINDVESVTNSRLSLYLHGNELHDNQSLRYYEITGNSEIDVVIKPSQTTTILPATSGGTINSKKLKLIVLTQCGTKKIPVEMNGSDNVGELRKELQRLQEILHFHLPPEGYFFIYKQNVMDDDRSFRWHHVGSGDMIEIFNGSVTGGLS